MLITWISVHDSKDGGRIYKDLSGGSGVMVSVLLMAMLTQALLSFPCYQVVNSCHHLLPQYLALPQAQNQ